MERDTEGQHFVKSGEFTGTPVNLSRVPSDSLNKTAQTFQSHAIANGIQPVQSGTADGNGEVHFSGLNTGLYLVSGRLLKIGTNYYVPATTLLEISEDDTEIIYNTYPKFEYQEINGQSTRAHIVYTEWEGDTGHTDKRPASVTVDIYRNEEYYDTVTLNADNRWRYRWVDTDGCYNWTVAEKNIPESYEVIIEYDNNYRILNSYDESMTTAPPAQESVTTTTALSADTGTVTGTHTVKSTATIQDVTETHTIITDESDTDITNMEEIPADTVISAETTSDSTDTITTIKETSTDNIVFSGDTETTITTENTIQLSDKPETITTVNNTVSEVTATTTESGEITVRKTTAGTVSETDNNDINNSSDKKIPVVPFIIGGVLIIAVIIVMKSVKK
ncbi:MAG: Cna B-type domain-containing protein [Ruminococcus sp.]|nr:Cna B-type domain-containing protein [Ruminococcus sp.]